MRLKNRNNPTSNDKSHCIRRAILNPDSTLKRFNERLRLELCLLNHYLAITYIFRAVADHQPGKNKNRVSSNSQLNEFATRLRQWMTKSSEQLNPTAAPEFESLALELFALQFARNPPYRKFCEARSASPGTIQKWTQIPAIPSAAFKELELSSIPAVERTKVFCSSGTTSQIPSRHFHHEASLELYEASLLNWFRLNVLSDRLATQGKFRIACLTPPPEHAPNSSLVYMLQAVRRMFGCSGSGFFGTVGRDANEVGKAETNSPNWVVDFENIRRFLEFCCEQQEPVLLLGTAFCFVHLFDYFAEHELVLRLPAGSRVMETGGYKGRSRVLPKSELHGLITKYLGVPPTQIICEYGMSELSSQAYDRRPAAAFGIRTVRPIFRFPPWARARVISPETGDEVNEGGTGLLQIFDLANVFSVAAIQTEDLATKRGNGFELLGRGIMAEPRGCSLMTP